ncbi:hypothetical protein AYO47_07580 [Planctomyces sp. SCGC AG-212-M04]|nr:hypothetical protein AYO47_07580 [Planctomyces sp. SCGC AG-212-M04]
MLMSHHVLKAAGRSYVWSVLGAVLLYAIALVISLRWLHDAPGPPWKYFIAVLPVLPALWIPLAAVRLSRQLDELQQRIQLEGLAFGFACSAVLILTYGFLQNAGLPELSWIWVWPVMGGCWIVGLLAARQRYR